MPNAKIPARLIDIFDGDGDVTKAMVTQVNGYAEREAAKVVMAEPSCSVATLRLFGDDLAPDEPLHCRSLGVACQWQLCCAQWLDDQRTWVSGRPGAGIQRGQLSRHARGA